MTMKKDIQPKKKPGKIIISIDGDVYKRQKYGKIIVLGKVFSFVMPIFQYFCPPFVPQATYGGQIYAPLCNLGTFHYKIYLNHR